MVGVNSIICLTLANHAGTKQHQNSDRMVIQQLQIVKHDSTAMMTPTPSPCEEGLLATVVRYINLT